MAPGTAKGKGFAKIHTLLAATELVDGTSGIAEIFLKVGTAELLVSLAVLDPLFLRISPRLVGSVHRFLELRRHRVDQLLGFVRLDAKVKSLVFKVHKRRLIGWHSFGQLERVIRFQSLDAGGRSLVRIFFLGLLTHFPSQPASRF
jgi:hypothetical protein